MPRGMDIDGEASSWVPKLDGDLSGALLRGRVHSLLFGVTAAPKIGRFEIEAKLGSGGMGVVYVARDPELRRRVAIKLLHSHLFTGADAVTCERARREGQALAQVSHPNVVEVFEVGEHEGRPFVAMEYIEGRTLGDWLAEDTPSWREVVEVFIEAGRGLLAAHRAGLVHRDFKPDNVLLSGAGEERRVRVLDFGLARLESAGDSMIAMVTAEHDDSAEITRPGSLLGTLMYMSPEQLRGETADAASDQFSFCVALYRGLWQQDPYGGSTIEDRLASVAGEPTSPPRRRGVPRSLWPIVRRGLRRQAAQRWPSMDELLASLERMLRGRRSAPVLAFAGLALGLGVWVGVEWRQDEPAPEDPCRHVAVAHDELWTPARAEQARARFEASDAKYAVTSFATVDAALARWSSAWSERRLQVCRGGEDGTVRAACFDRAQAEVALLVQAMIAADEQTITQAVTSLGELPSLSVCDDDEAVRLGLEPIPEGIEPEIVRLREALARARVLRLTGHRREAVEMIAGIERDAAKIDYGPFAAELAVEQALLALAQVVATDMSDQLAQLENAAMLAERSRHDRLAAVAWTVLTYWATNPGAVADERVERWFERAEIGVARLGSPASLQARLYCIEGVLLARDPRRVEAARESLEHGLDLLATLDAGDISTIWRPRCLMNLALLHTGEHAVELAERALADAEAQYGLGHPDLVHFRFTLARVLLQSGLPDAGLRSAIVLGQLADARLAAYDTSAIVLGQAHADLAAAAFERGEIEAARHHVAVASQIFAQVLPPDDYQHAQPLLIAAMLEYADGAYETALAHFDDARVFMIDQPGLALQVSDLDRNRAYCLLKLERLDEAERLLLAQRPADRSDADIEASLALISTRRHELAARD
jgi:predicted Ser/Thr protein kinase